MVKIEEGKFYRTRLGDRIGPAIQRGLGPFHWRVGDDLYRDDGAVMSMLAEHPRDIIGEDLAEPTMEQVLDGIRRAINNPLNKGVDVDQVVLDGKTWVRQPAPPPPELPKWKCHKIVSADKIIKHKHGVLTLACGVMVEPGKNASTNLSINLEPIVGGYYVRYADGYESWSPAKAFEEGYSRMPYGSHEVVGRTECSCGVTRIELLDGVAALECPQRPFKR